jgi:hypothetical protein
MEGLQCLTMLAKNAILPFLWENCLPKNKEFQTARDEES